MSRLRRSPVKFPGVVEVTRILCGILQEKVQTAAAAYQAERDEKLKLAEDQRQSDAVVLGMIEAESVRRKGNMVQGLPMTYHEGHVSEPAARLMKYAMINGTDIEVSRVSMGLGSATGSYGHINHDEAVEAIRTAHQLGINFFDTSPMYGYDRSGESILREALAGRPRESYYLSTKVGRYLEKVPDEILGGHRYIHSPDYSGAAVRASVMRSLELMQVDYLDMVWVQDPHFCTSYRRVKNGCLSELQAMKDEGYIRFVGLAGYDMTVMHSVLTAQGLLMVRGEKKEVDAVQVVGRYNILDTSLTSTKSIPYRFIEHCVSRNIGVVSAAPMAMGLFTPQGPPVWHSAGPEIREAAEDIVAHCAAAGVDVTRVCMFFAFNSEWMSSQIVGMRTPAEVVNAVTCMTEPMTKEEAACLNWSLHRLDDLQFRNWVEKDAVYTGSGPLNDRAESARHWSDSELLESPHIYMPGTRRTTKNTTTVQFGSFSEK